MRTVRRSGTPSAGSATHSATGQAQNRCQMWVSTGHLDWSHTTFAWLARLAGFEPVTRCLEGTPGDRRKMPDVA
jgi:hypothetical protein